MHCAALAACLDPAQDGPRALPRRARGRCPHTRPLTGGSRPSEASSSSRHRSGEHKLRAGELPASAARRASFPGPSRTRRPPLHPLYLALASATTGTADGRFGRANAGRPRRVECELSNAKVSVAHRGSSGARIGSGKAWSEAGHGGGACGGSPAGVGEEQFGGGLWWVSACAWGCNRWWGSRRSCWGAQVAWNGNG